MSQNRHFTFDRVTSLLSVSAAIAEMPANSLTVAVSGAFDPLHIGNLKCIQGASMLKGENGLLVVIVNSDDYCIKKKGYVFMPLEERMELISALRGVDYVVSSSEENLSVCDALRVIKPKIFAKGGKHTMGTPLPEAQACQEIGCSIVYGIGGKLKLQSSSKLVEDLQTKREK